MLTNSMVKGTITSVRDGIIGVSGLSSVMSGELLYIELTTGELGKALVSTISETGVDAVFFGGDHLLSEGNGVYRSFTLFTVPVGLQMFGKVVNALGEPQDLLALSQNSAEEFESICDEFPGCKGLVERRAPGILDRQPVNQPLQTGIRAIDCLIPIGRGQRELIIGDRQTGKSSLLFDIMLNLKRENPVGTEISEEGYTISQLQRTIWAVYVSIGHRKGRVARIWDDMLAYKMERYICLVVAFASDPAPLQFLAAYSGCAQGEYIRDVLQGDAVIFYNDLSKHAVAYRQMSLLLRRPSGREAYPGDVFYIHSRLLERAAKLSEELGGGSLTAFPVIETQAGDITAYIPTNVISITDGQIFLEAALFYKGVRPAINVGLSVSRVGSAAQLSSMKKLAGSLKLALAQFREVEVFARLAVNLTNVATLNLIKRGRVLTQLFIQREREPVSVIIQVMLLYAALNGRFDEIELTKVSAYVEGFNKFASEIVGLNFFMEREAEVVTMICEDTVLVNWLFDAYNAFLRSFRSDSVLLSDFILE